MLTMMTSDFIDRTSRPLEEKIKDGIKKFKRAHGGIAPDTCLVCGEEGRRVAAMTSEQRFKLGKRVGITVGSWLENPVEGLLHFRRIEGSCDGGVCAVD